mmetsp:Transcript_10200/g.25445  ORF Transcript_10200/g.25445 Transcript_10200/m.25445 type:complete len:208 (+) Transcript_10200:3-626(+)
MTISPSSSATPASAVPCSSGSSLSQSACATAVDAPRQWMRGEAAAARASEAKSAWDGGTAAAARTMAGRSKPTGVGCSSGISKPRPSVVLSNTSLLLFASSTAATRSTSSALVHPSIATKSGPSLAAARSCLARHASSPVKVALAPTRPSAAWAASRPFLAAATASWPRRWAKRTFSPTETSTRGMQWRYPLPCVAYFPSNVPWPTS